MARNKKVEILSHSGEVLHPITDGDCVIFPDGETLTHKLSEQEEVMYTPEVVNSSPMFKVGEGDSSDYSANVLDGAYQEAVLKGQTYVNTIQEPSADVITLPTPFTEYERTQSKTFTEMQDGTFGLNLVGQSYVNCIQEPSEPSYVALGENLEFQNKKVEYTTDGQIKSAMLNGMTLVNLTNGHVSLTDVDNVYCSFSNGVYTYQAKNSYEGRIAPANILYLRLVQPLKQNTTYTLIVEQISGGNSSFGVRVGYSANDFSDISEQQSYTGIHKVAFSTSSTKDVTTLSLRLGAYTNERSISFKNIMVVEGDHTQEDIPYFQGMQSVTMATELENVCSRYNSSLAKGGTTFTVGSSTTRALKLSDVANIGNYGFKQNTKYLIQFKISNLNLDGLTGINLYFSEGDISGGNALFGNLANATVRISKNGIYRVVLTTSNIVSTSGFVVKGYSTEWEGSTSTTRKLTISQIMCIEYQNGMENWDLPYFETTQLMKPFKVRTMSKNLCPVGKGQFFNCFFKAGTQFTLSTKDGVASNGGNIVFKDKDGNSMWLGIDSGTSISRTTLAKDAYQIVNQLNSEAIQYQLEEGASVTSFVPREEETISALEPITLRAIGNVKDTLDLSTGEYVQRIGEINIRELSKIDGRVKKGGWDNGTYMSFDFITPDAVKNKTNVITNISNLFQSVIRNPETSNSMKEFVTNTASGNIFVMIRKDRLASSDLDGFKQWLENNELIVQYELENPITRKISLEYPNLQTYQDITHVQSIAMDGTLIPKIFLPSDISYRAMLKPNTSYNVIVDREVIDSTNQLTVNLGGTTTNITTNRTVVRTPSTLSNETLTFSGKDNRLAKAMLIEGSTLINGDLPHFDGIGDVKLGRIVENLCMANEILAGSATSTSTLYTDRIEIKITKEGSCVETFELTKQLQNGKKYFVYCPWNCSSSSHIFGAGFRMSYNGSISFAQQVKGVDNKKYIIFTIDEKEQLNPYTHFTIGFHGGMAVNTTMTIRRPILCEYIDGMENWDWESIGYFTGTRNIGNEFMRIGNKNLFISKDLILGANQYWANQEYNINAGHTSRATLNQLIQVTPSCTLTLTFSDNYNGVIQEYISKHKRTKYNDEGWHDNIHTLKLDEKTKYVNVYFRKKDDTQFTTDELNVLKNSIQLEEASSATSYVAHKHNSLHILPNEQIPLTFEQGGVYYTKGDTWTNAVNNINTARIRTQLFDLEPNETYRISCGNNGYNFAVYSYDNSLLGTSDTAWLDGEYYISTTKDINRIAIAIRKADNSNLTPSVLHQVRLEKVTDVTLRSIGNVKDELDLTRGVYVQRIDEVVLDGTKNDKINNYAIFGDNNHFITIKLLNKKDGDKLAIYFNEMLSSYNGGSLSTAGSNPLPNKLMITNDKNIRFTFSGGNNLDLNTELEMLKKYPITVQYVLETPIEHKINVPAKNEVNQTIAKPNGVFTLPLMYSGNNHVDINSQIYPKVQSRDYISYPVIANNSQLHTVFHNKVGTGNLTVNLCGTSGTSVDGTSKCKVTTPSTISQYELRLSGARNKVSNVCVFSGDYTNVNVPYVEGMMNAVNPIVKNVGKNLFDGVVKNGEGWWNGKVDPVAKCRRSVNLTPVKPNTEYSFKLANNRGVNFMAHGKDGKYLKYMGWFPSDTRKFTTPSDCYYIHWYNDIDDFTDFYIEESPTPSQYEPYKENICEPHSDEIIALRSLPNRVRDELNLQTGEYIQRIGEMTLNDNDYIIDYFLAESTNEYSLFAFVKNDIKNAINEYDKTQALCDKLPYEQIWNNKEKEGFFISNDRHRVFIRISNDKLSGQSVDALNEYLSSNPIKVQYQLETPIIKQVGIHNYPHSYKDGHVIIESNDPSTNVTAQMTYRCVTNRSGQIQEHTEQVEKQERQINELETLILENIRQQQNRSQNFLTSLISTLEIEEE